MRPEVFIKSSSIKVKLNCIWKDEEGGTYGNPKLCGNFKTLYNADALSFYTTFQLRDSINTINNVIICDTILFSIYPKQNLDTIP